jgi:hypothetical protein
MDHDTPKTRTEKKKGRTKECVYSGKHARLMEERQKNGSDRVFTSSKSRKTK